MRRYATLAITAAALTVTLAACQQAPTSDTTAQPTVTETPGWIPETPTSSEAASLMPHTPGTTPTGDVTAPKPDDASTKDMKERAIGAVEAFLNTEGGQSAWKTRITPYLTPEALDDYGSIDISKIPPVKLKPETAKLDSDVTDHYGTVLIDSTDGQWGATLKRDSLDSPWQVTEFVIPDKWA